MIFNYYVYPHPILPDVWLYTGQGNKRDYKHRTRQSSFGRRFKKRFLNTKLTQPIRLQFEAQDQIHANAIEQGLMFKYGTWHEYEWGMNLTIPGSQDYKNTGSIGGKIRAESGSLKGIASLGGSISKRDKTGIFSSDYDHSLGGQITKQRKVGIFAPGMQAKGGRAHSQIPKEKLRFALLKTPEHQRMASNSRDPKEHRETGQKAGRKRVESGFFSPELQGKRSREYWHNKKLTEPIARSSAM